MSSVHQPVPQLRRRRLGVIHLLFFTVAASAPLTVLGGGVTTTFAVTGNAGVPLSFLVLAVALALFAVGYAAMSRHVANAGAFYSYLAQGLGPRWAVSGSFVALLSYNAIQIGLYGLFGASLAGFLSSTFGITLPWWALAVAALIVVGALGVLRVDLNARVLAVLLILECIIVALYDISAFGHPAGGSVSFAGLTPSNLFTPTVGAVFAFSIAGFIGFESGAIYSEECRNPRVTVARATFAALTFTGLFYALSAWAMTVNVGAENLQAEAGTKQADLVFSVLAQNWGGGISVLGNLLFLTSVFAALLSFHNGVARYLFALGRERVLLAAFSRVGAASGGPLTGSLAQSALAIVVVVAFAIFGADPVLQLFTWFSGTSAVGVVLLMAVTSVAVVGYFRRHRDAASTWQGLVAPVLATIVLFAIVAILVINFDVLMGSSDPGWFERGFFPGLMLVVALLGLGWAAVIKRNKPAVYKRIGQTAMAPEVVEPKIQLNVPTPPRAG
ncbi:APC family permease [Pseudonocardia sp. GCM10023141]|uniref:APC family permease n=1 Tax=Pseudonocardia sp. GCM10023141 TaxID=3252653 RepID=UPI003607E0E6